MYHFKIEVSEAVLAIVQGRKHTQNTENSGFRGQNEHVSNIPFVPMPLKLERENILYLYYSIILYLKYINIYIIYNIHIHCIYTYTIYIYIIYIYNIYIYTHVYIYKSFVSKWNIGGQIQIDRDTGTEEKRCKFWNLS